MSFTRRDLARALKERVGGTIESHDEWLSQLLQLIKDTVSEGERIELRGFGTFESREISGHKTQNPVTGEPMKNPKSYTVDFRPAEGFKEQLKDKKAKNSRG